MKSRICALFLCVAMIASLSLPASATTTKSVDDNFSTFHSEIFDAVQNQLSTEAISNDLEMRRHETVQELRRQGYDAYEVTGSNYDNIEATLNTDLSAIGLSDEFSYIVVVGDNTGVSSDSRSTIGSTYNYTYNGTTYTMRTMKITSADDPNYLQSTSKDLMSSHSSSVIQALLDATIGAYMSFFGVPMIFGTIASITGLTAVDLTSNSATAVFHASTAWTRTFTQVWDNNLNAWTYGSSVEYAQQICFFDGLRYNAELNTIERYESGVKEKITYSQYYNSSTWKNEKAIIGLLTAMPVFYDKTGDACYEYDSSVIVRHREGF